MTIVRHYLNAINAGAPSADIAQCFTADAEQVELPNRLNPGGGRSDLAELLRRYESVPTLLSSQRFDVLSEIASGDRVAVEATWTGVLAVPLGSTPAGTRLTAHFAMFFELEGGRIRRQRNYDCFEPW